MGDRQPLTEVVTCLGDGHDGVWNLMEKIGVKRREILDWYHLVENMKKIGGSNKRLNRIKENLWKGEVKRVLEELEGCKKKQAINFTNMSINIEKEYPITNSINHKGFASVLEV